MPDSTASEAESGRERSGTVAKVVSPFEASIFKWLLINILHFNSMLIFMDLLTIYDLIYK
jgi:hypothetical protein